MVELDERPEEAQSPELGLNRKPKFRSNHRLRWHCTLLDLHEIALYAILHTVQDAVSQIAVLELSDIDLTHEARLVDG
jgi:hypothetical protein